MLYAAKGRSFTASLAEHVAPPLALVVRSNGARLGGFLLIDSCFQPPPVPAGRTLLGCARTVTPTGADQGYIAIHGDAIDGRRIAELLRLSDAVAIRMAGPDATAVTLGDPILPVVDIDPRNENLFTAVRRALRALIFDDLTFTLATGEPEFEQAKAMIVDMICGGLEPRDRLPVSESD